MPGLCCRYSVGLREVELPEKCSDDPSIISAGYLHHETCCPFRKYFEVKNGCTAWTFGLSLCSVSNTNQTISSSKLWPQQLSVQTWVSRNIFLTWLNGWFHFTRSTILMVHWKMAFYFLKGNYYWTYTPHLSLNPWSREKGFQLLGTQKKIRHHNLKRLAPRPSCWRIGRFPPPGKSSCLVVLGMNSSRPVVFFCFLRWCFVSVVGILIPAMKCDEVLGFYHVPPPET